MTDTVYWLENLLGRFDPSWLVDEDGLDVDRRSRSGIRRISADDVVTLLDRLCALFRKDRGKLVNYCRGRLGPFGGDAEDVVQRVMCKIAASPPELGHPDKLEPYVYSALHNETNSTGRRSSSEQSRRSPDQDGVDVADLRAGFEDRIVFQLVMARALALLTPQQRRMVVLVNIQQFTVKDAAAELGIAHGTAKRHHFDAIHRLRDDPGLNALRPST